MCITPLSWSLKGLASEKARYLHDTVWPWACFSSSGPVVDTSDRQVHSIIMLKAGSVLRPIQVLVIALDKHEMIE